MNDNPFRGTPSRFISLANTHNMRDLGGIRTRNGSITNFGVFYRSDVPTTWTTGDDAALGELGITTVVDLRQPYELERDINPYSSVSSVDYHNVQLSQHIIDNNARPTDVYDISAFYVAALDNASAAIRLTLEILAAAPGGAVFHCTAGKDRTGLIAAVILDLVGSHQADIIADYELTHHKMGPIRERLIQEALASGEDIEQFKRLLGARAQLIQPALTRLGEYYGGAERYLLGAGITPSVIAQLRRKLLT